MKRHWWLVLAVLMSVVLMHDVSMAAMGHPAASIEDAIRLPTRHDATHDHHHRSAGQVRGEPDDTVPESCGTVRPAPARQDAPERLPLPDPILGAIVEPWQAITRAISVPLLVNPLSDSPSACLARFQVFRI